MDKKLIIFGLLFGLQVCLVSAAKSAQQDKKVSKLSIDDLRVLCTSKKYTTQTPFPVILRIKNGSDKAIGFVLRMHSSRKLVITEPLKSDCEYLFKQDYSCKKTLVLGPVRGRRVRALSFDRKYNLAAKSEDLICIVVFSWDAFLELEIQEQDGDQLMAQTMIDKRNLDWKKISKAVPPHPPCPESIDIFYKSKGEYDIDIYKGAIPEHGCVPSFPPKGV